MTSAYPKTVDALMPGARQLTVELGHVPSRNHLMSSLHIGRDKANAIRARLTDERDNQTAPPVSNDTEQAPTRRLHAVPDTHPDDTDDQPTPVSSDETAAIQETAAEQASPQAAVDAAPVSSTPTRRLWTRLRATATPVPADTRTPVGRPARTWPLVLLALPAFVAIWSGWVGLGTLTGFGPVHPLPGIANGFTLNTAITLPIGVETYAAYALRVWLAGYGAGRARLFAKWSAIGSLVLGAAGQVAYHLMTARHLAAAPWPITTAVACLPVIVLGFGAALAHLQHTTDRTETA